MDNCWMLAWRTIDNNNNNNTDNNNIDIVGIVSPTVHDIFIRIYH